MGGVAQNLKNSNSKVNFWKFQKFIGWINFLTPKDTERKNSFCQNIFFLIHGLSGYQKGQYILFDKINILESFKVLKVFENADCW